MKTKTKITLGAMYVGAIFAGHVITADGSVKVENQQINPMKGKVEGVVAIEQHETVTYDPCGLEVVVCDSEKKKEKKEVPQDVNRVLKAIIMAESGGDPNKESETDITADGHVFSVGLIQANITVHRIGGLDCPKAFKGKDYGAVVVDKKLYKQCVAKAKDPEVAIQKMKEIYKSSGYGAWGAFNNKSYLKFM